MLRVNNHEVVHFNYEPFASKTDIAMSASVDASIADVAAGFEGILINRNLIE